MSVYLKTEFELLRLILLSGYSVEVKSLRSDSDNLHDISSSLSLCYLFRFIYLFEIATYRFVAFVFTQVGKELLQAKS